VIFTAMRRACEHSDCDCERVGEHCRRLHSLEVGITGMERKDNTGGQFLEGRSRCQEFPVHAEESAHLPGSLKDNAISCNSDYGPLFCDISVSITCTDDIRLDRKTFFTPSYIFRVKEIEVFEIKDTQTPLPPNRGCALILNCF
jgi:hypothetical protein